MKIDHPSQNQIPQLRELWKKAFADGDEYLDLFFSRAFDPVRCRCVSEDGRILAALYWFRVSCSSQELAYLYAITTDPDHRGKGYCRVLVEDTKKLLAEAGFYGVLLVPDGDGLADMYRKMGFDFCSSVAETVCTAAKPSVSFRQIDGAEYARLRQTYLPRNAVIQENESLDLLSALCSFYAGADWIAAANIDGSLLFCPEFLGNTDAAPGFISALGCNRGTFRTSGDRFPFAMFCPLRPNAVPPKYFAFAFD